MHDYLDEHQKMAVIALEEVSRMRRYVSKVLCRGRCGLFC